MYSAHCTEHFKLLFFDVSCFRRLDIQYMYYLSTLSTTYIGAFLACCIYTVWHGWTTLYSSRLLFFPEVSCLCCLSIVSTAHYANLDCCSQRSRYQAGHLKNMFGSESGGGSFLKSVHPNHIYSYSTPR